MKKNICVSLTTVIVLALILSGLRLGLNSTAQANAQNEYVRKMSTLLPNSYIFVTEKYTGEDPNIRKVHRGENGYVIETAVQGYADEIVLMVGVTDEGKVTGLSVRDMHETYGLGNAALTDWEFLAQFLNTKGDAKIGENVDAISGATVTSNAIARSVNSAVAYVTGADIDSSATPGGG